MPNKYPGTCYRCGKPVAKGTGVFEKTGASQRKKWPGRPLPKWLTQHHECARQFRGTERHFIFSPDA